MRKIVTEPLVLSSQEVRAALREGRDISQMVPPAVKKYIADNHLYV